MDAAPRYRWFVSDDINGFFGLVVDNLSVMAFLATVLVGAYQFPADIVFGRMFPGTALGVLVGDGIYTWMAIRLAKRTGRTDVTAMPLGLDTPSTIGMALLVLGPAFVAFKQAGMDEREAAIATWHLGMAATVIMGVLKFALAFVGSRVQRMVPQAGLLGSIAGIALMLIGFIPILEIMRLPVVGFVSLGLVLYALVARGKIPGKLPGVLVAFAVGAVLYFGLGYLGLSGGEFHPPHGMQLRFALPYPSLGFVGGLRPSLTYLPLIVPFALLTVVGGINVTESARVAGDDYSTRDILLVEAVATLAAGFLGGVAQTTPYIGQPAFKRMGARAGYTLMTGLFVGLGGVLGYLANIVEVLPLAVLAPILVFVALEITIQAFEVTPSRHAVAVAFSFFPAIARMLAIKLGDPAVVPAEQFAKLLTAGGQGLPAMDVVVALGNGFIITSMIWAGFVVEMVDRRLRVSAAYLAAGAVLTLFGIIHSAKPDGSMYFAWALDGMPRLVALQFAGAYVALAAVLMLLSLQRDEGR
jgi:AGZA family xanthine/uracil permease-like MFS transporter